LDEIGELPYDLQVKLLQVIQDGQVSRLGGTSKREVDVRFVAASNKDLFEMVEQRRFRADLFYRLNVVPIRVPALKEREEDIPYLVLHFLETFCDRYGVTKNISKDAMDIICRYDWPGNVRELKNMIEYLAVMIKGEFILPEHLPDKIRPGKYTTRAVLVSGLMPLKEAVCEVEKQVINIALNECGSVRKAAKSLGVSHSTVLRKIQLSQSV
jgi:transcriptional regulator with PAS, ATPase and Fis domain